MKETLWYPVWRRAGGRDLAVMGLKGGDRGDMAERHLVLMGKAGTDVGGTQY
jgi:hypothetical protein